jgi:putative oxidoreductase
MTDETIIDETSRIEADRLLIPGLAGFYHQVAPLGYAVLRIALALMFLSGGIDKLFLGGAGRIAAGNITRLGLAPTTAWAWLVTGVEFFGAILLGLGLFTRPAAFALTVELFVIAFFIMLPRGVFWTSGGIEVALLMMLMAIGFVFGGGGRYSLDRRIGREF